MVKTLTRGAIQRASELAQPRQRIVHSSWTVELERVIQGIARDGRRDEHQTAVGDADISQGQNTWMFRETPDKFAQCADRVVNTRGRDVDVKDSDGSVYMRAFGGQLEAQCYHGPSGRSSQSGFELESLAVLNLAAEGAP